MNTFLPHTRALPAEMRFTCEFPATAFAVERTENSLNRTFGRGSIRDNLVHIAPKCVVLYIGAI